MSVAMRALGLAAVWTLAGSAQNWDPGPKLSKEVAGLTEGKLKLTFESRTRYESRTGMSFGKEPDRDAVLLRNRLGIAFSPVKWFRVSAMVQDARAPLYGTGAPNNVRDFADLQEGLIEFRPQAKKGFGLAVGRAAASYGEGRLIGTPQWGNVGRTYDQARATWRARWFQADALFVSTVKVRVAEFNKPVLGERVWGMYNAVPNVAGKSVLEFYVLRHDQNRTAGFTGGSTALGTDRLGTNTFGFRLAGPLGTGWKYSVEDVWQTGKIGPAGHRAAALFAGVTRRWTIQAKPLDVSGEYKYASGTANPKDVTKSGTFDQLFAANHDKFGHADLLGWRNIHNVRSLATLGWTKNLAFNLMYNEFWLASARDGFYNGSGKLIARSADGSAGRHVGREADAFFTYRYRQFQFGAGYGFFFNGAVVIKTTPGASPSYVYVFQTYSF